MTNIRSFLKHNETCPSCNNDTMNFRFISKDNKILRLINDDIRIKLTINGFPLSKNKKKFDIYLNINMTTNIFSIDFLDAVEDNLKFIPEIRMTDCKNYLQYKITHLYIECGICKNYHYNSNFLEFDFSSSRIKPFGLMNEVVYITKLGKEGELSRYYLINNFEEKRADIIYDKIDISKMDPWQIKNLKKPDKNMLNVPLVKYKDIKQLSERLETIIFFS